MKIEQLKIVGLTKFYGKIKVLDSVDFQASKGDFIAIIGTSGAGKSTLLRSINKLTTIDEGDIFFEGSNIKSYNKNKTRKLRREIGMIFQNYSLVERLTVLENTLHGRLGYKKTIAGSLGIYSKEEKKNAIEILEKLSLKSQIYKRCDEISGGQKQRVGIARTILQNPKIILADEPVSSLDKNTSSTIMQIFKNINEEMNMTIIISLHQLDLALQYATRIIGINGGKIVFDGKRDSITENDISEIYK